MNHIKDLIDSTMEKLHAAARTETVVGQPLEVKGRVIIPLISLSMGAAGGGSQSSQPAAKGKKEAEDKPALENLAGGVGVGAKIVPIAVISVDERGVSVYRTDKPGAIDKLAGILPVAIEKAMEKIEDYAKSKKASESKEED